MEKNCYPKFSISTIIKKGAYNLPEFQIINLNSGKLRSINNSALEILKLCNGLRSITEIIQILANYYSLQYNQNLNLKVMNFISRCRKEGFLDVHTKPAPSTQRIIEKRHSCSLDHIYFALTNKCNFSCIYCYNPSNLKMLSHREVALLLAQCNELGVLNVTLTGGEPLLVPYFSELIPQIIRYGMSYNLFTNGYLLKGSNLRTVLNYPPALLCISIGSFKDSVLQKIALKPIYSNFYEKLLSKLTKYNINLRVNCTLVPSINDSIKDIREYELKLKNLGIENILFSEVMSYGKGANISLRTSFNIAREIGILQRSNCITTDTRQFSNNFEITNYTGDPICGTGTFLVSILPNGNVVPCVVLQDIVVGNIFDESLSNIWNKSNLLKKYRIAVRINSKKCIKCKYIFYCRGGCKAKALMYSGKLNGPDLWSCSYFVGQESQKHSLSSI